MRFHRAWALLLLLLAAPSYSGDEWSDPYAGVRYLHRTTESPRHSIHVLFVDLTEPTIRVIATPPGGDGTVSQFARRSKSQLAVNGDFFNIKNREPSGLAIGDGKVWPGSKDGDDAVFAAGRGRVEIFLPETVVKPEPWMTAAVGGHPLLLRDGEADPAGVWEARHPRTAVGLTKDRKTLILLVVDGRQSHSVGMTGREMQKFFLELGAWTALNLDGGGSSAMYIDGPGVVNKPSDGRERAVANHLGVQAVKGATRPKGQVRGTVKDTEGKPLAGVKVSIGSGMSDVTDAKGVFHLSQVRAGDVSLAASLKGYVDGKVRLRVKAREVAEAAIEMKPKPSPPDKR